MNQESRIMKHRSSFQLLFTPKTLLLGMVLLLLSAGYFLLTSSETQAARLKLAPLLYNETLSKNEKKKGFIDISNPNDETVTINTEIQAFRQVNNNGDFEFYNKPEYLQGIQLDYKQFSLGPREALRLYFLLDAAKLPSGGIYASIFFKTATDGVNPDNTSIQTIVRVGTLLVIDNDGGAPKDAAVETLDAPLFQFGHSLQARAQVKNVGGNNGLAFFPKVQTAVQPFGSTTDTTAPLVFPGITREMPLKLSGSYFGLVRLRATTGISTKYRWTFVAIGHGRWIGPLLMLLGAIIAGLLVKLRRIRQKQSVSG